MCRTLDFLPDGVPVVFLSPTLVMEHWSSRCREASGKLEAVWFCLWLWLWLWWLLLLLLLLLLLKDELLNIYSGKSWVN